MRSALAVALVFAAAATAAWLPAASAQDSSCPLSFMATATDPGTVGFHWSGFGGADGYQVFGQQGQGSTFGASAMLSGDARDAGVKNLGPGTYDFWVDAFHSGTIVAQSCHRTVEVTPTLAQACVTGLIAIPEAGGSAQLFWGRVDGATGYDIARSVDGGALQHDYGTAGQGNHPGFTDTGLQAGHSYHYVVTSQNTRQPPESCNGVTIAIAQVPFFPTPMAWAAAIATVAGAGVLLRRRV